VFAGDEFSKSKKGNNNTYCQDNELTWISWELDEQARSMLEFMRSLVAFRRAHHTFRRIKFFRGKTLLGGQARDLHWARPEGSEMGEADWNNIWTRSLGLLIPGAGIDDVNKFGRRIIDDTFFLVMNAHHEPVDFVLPPSRIAWRFLFDTGRDEAASDHDPLSTYSMESRSLALFCKPRRSTMKLHRKSAAFQKGTSQ
jgi:isoamylase